jgi:hypothetical protein
MTQEFRPRRAPASKVMVIAGGRVAGRRHCQRTLRILAAKRVNLLLRAPSEVAQALGLVATGPIRIDLQRRSLRRGRDVWESFLLPLPFPETVRRSCCTSAWNMLEPRSKLWRRSLELAVAIEGGAGSDRSVVACQALDHVRQARFFSRFSRPINAMSIGPRLNWPASAFRVSSRR